MFRIARTLSMTKTIMSFSVSIHAWMQGFSKNGSVISSGALAFVLQTNSLRETIHVSRSVPAEYTNTQTCRSRAREILLLPNSIDVWTHAQEIILYGKYLVNRIIRA